MENKRSILFIKKYSRLIALVIFLVLLILIGRKIFSKSSGSNTANQQATIAKPIKSTVINRTFAFPILDENDKEVSKIKYTIENAELRDEIIVQGQRVRAIEGRTFLIVTIKIANSFDKSIEMNTKDYLRLSVNKNNSEWLAPDIHNDPVQVQAISAKSSRLGFPINDSDKDLVLQIGEIEGKKEKIEIKF